MEFPKYFELSNFDEVLDFIKMVIKNNEEWSFSKFKAINNVITAFYLNLVNKRKLAIFLLDDCVDLQNDQLECLRIKFLFLIYENNENEVEEILKSQEYESSSSVYYEIKYQIALITFYKALFFESKSEQIIKLKKSKECFFILLELDSSKKDVLILHLSVTYLLDLLSDNIDNRSDLIKKIEDEIIIIDIYQYDSPEDYFFLDFGRTIINLNKIIIVDEKTWTDYHLEFMKLQNFYNNMINNSYKKEDICKKLSNKVKLDLKVDTVEPFFKSSFNSILCKINILLSNDLSIEDCTFLEYVKDIISLEDGDDIEVNDAIEKVLEIDMHSENYILNQIFENSIYMLNNFNYGQQKEDIRNDYIRDLLKKHGYNVLDQTRRGVSEQGKGAGEVDLLIERKGLNICLIEALNLKSLETTNLSNHIDKIYKYDTIGNKFNFIICYINIKKFDGFADKYHNFAKEYVYPFKSLEFNEVVEYKCSNIRIFKNKLLREGVDTNLYHILIYFNSA